LTLGVRVDLDPEIEIERQQRMERLKAELTEQLARGNAAAVIDQLVASMLEMELENERLAWRVLLAKRYRFGTSSERLSREELAQLYLAFAGDPRLVGADDPPVPTPEQPEQTEDSKKTVGSDSLVSAPEKPKGKKRQRVRSMKADPSVVRNVTTVAVPKEEQTCALCGTKKKVFGCVEHRTFRYVPAHIEVDVERREKSGCDRCRHRNLLVDLDQSFEKFPFRILFVPHSITSSC
jgi:hypothetical protein